MQASSDSARRIRVAMVSPYYYPLWGGAENQARSLACRLAARGLVDVTVLTLHLFGGGSEEYLDSHRIIRFGIASGDPAAKTGLKDILAWLRAHRNAYDLVHQTFIYGQFPDVQLQVGQLCTELGKPSLLKITSSNKVSQLSAGFESGRELLRTYSRIVAINSDIDSELLLAGVGRERILNVANGVDTAVFRPASAEERQTTRNAVGLSEGDFAILYVGRLVAKKNLHVLLRACAAVASRGTTTRLFVVGDDAGDREKKQPDNVPIEAELKALACELAVECDWIGGLGRPEEIRAYYWCADCFVLPSRNEGCSNALLEAMSCGVACIASDLRANDEVLGGMRRWSFAADDTEGLAKSLNELAASPTVRDAIGAEVRSRAHLEFDIENVATVYENAYRELLSL